MKKKMIICCIGILCVLCATAAPVMAAEKSDAADKNVQVGVISYDKETGITLYRDAAGGTVISGLLTEYNIALKEQEEQKKMLENARKSEDASLSYPSVENDRSSAANQYVDYEYDPIYIGTWSGTRCYARHTLGKYNSSQKRLTSYGYATWYNTKGLTALPYRNGAANNGSGQGVADVVKGSYFDIRDIGNDKAKTLKVNDWGPNQSVAPNKIADLDKSDFEYLHGNSSDGVFYCRTWVPINNYNPS